MIGSPSYQALRCVICHVCPPLDFFNSRWAVPPSLSLSSSQILSANILVEKFNQTLSTHYTHIWLTLVWLLLLLLLLYAMTSIAVTLSPFDNDNDTKSNSCRQQAMDTYNKLNILDIHATHTNPNELSHVNSIKKSVSQHKTTQKQNIEKTKTTTRTMKMKSVDRIKE